MSYDNLQQIWARPSLIILTDTEPNAGTGSNTNKWDLGDNYLYLSDDSRSDLSISFERIEHKQRMINGTMRSYHVADKRTYSTSWKGLPSRKDFVSEVEMKNLNNFAGGQEILDWYNTHNGSFWALFVYDSDATTVKSDIKYNVETVNVFFESFSYNVTKRRLDTDLWDITLSLVEV